MRRAVGSLVLTLGLVSTFTVASAQTPAITPADAATIAGAIARDPATVIAASFVTGSSGNANAVSTVPLTSFATHGDSYGILTSGDATLADDARISASVGNPATVPPSDLVRGNTDFDVSILKVDLGVPGGRNCLSIDFQFLSEEYPDFVGGSFNDAFIAELDSSTWTTSGSVINAPNNFAFDQQGNPVSINSSGVASMSAANAAGTAYEGYENNDPDPHDGNDDGGATTLLRASTPVTPGNHSLYLSIFDQGDQILDSAVFLDNVSLGATGPGGCQPGASLPPPVVSKAADVLMTPAGGANGYTITVSNPNDVPVDLDSMVDTLPSRFAYVPGSTSGDVTADPSVAGQTLTWEGSDGPLVSVPAGGSVALHFGVTVSSTPAQYFNEAGATASGFAIEMTGPTAPVTVTAQGPPPQACDPITLEGTGAGETLLGTAGADRIRGLAGRDRIDALGDDDELCGGLGGDYLYGRDGLDTVRGEEGNDRLYGGRGGDVLEGGPGHDATLGGRGPDTIQAADGTKDCIVTGRGDDSVTADPFDVSDPKKGCPPGFWL